jgi:sigma-B regulation protein RsbU (phosphoserine phosphatase)
MIMNARHDSGEALWVPAAEAGDGYQRRALIAEDDASERTRLRFMLESLGFEVAAAANGEDALAQLQEGYRPGLIVSDWQMPGMNGLALCENVRRREEARDAYFILVTAQTSPSAIEEGLEAGADDFLSKPYRSQELRARVKAGRREFVRRFASQAHNDWLTNQLAIRKASARRVETDLQAAARLQQRQRPPRVGLIGGLEVGHFAASAGSLAGDAFGCVQITPRATAFYMLDVVGHGVPAAMNSFALARVLSSPRSRQDLFCRHGRTRPPAEVVAMLNERFPGEEECDQYFTMVYGTLDTVTGRGLLCQAGHPHPLVLGRDGEVTPIGDGGFPVGVLESPVFEDTEFVLSDGAKLALFSDGVSDVLNVTGQRFGQRRLVNMLGSVGSDDVGTAVGRIEIELHRWRGQQAWEDDASLMLLARPAEGHSK